MAEIPTQNQTTLRRPVRQIQQQEEKKERIKLWMGATLVITAASIDICEAALDVLMIGEFISPVISVCADVGFWIWFKILGVSFTKNPKNFAAMGIQALVGITPGLDILPELTLGVLTIVIVTRNEDKGGLLNKAAGMAQRDALGTQKQGFGESRSRALKEEDRWEQRRQGPQQRGLRSAAVSMDSGKSDKGLNIPNSTVEGFKMGNQFRAPQPKTGKAVEMVGSGIKSTGTGIQRTGQAVQYGGKGVKYTGQTVKYGGKAINVVGKGAEAVGKGIGGVGKGISTGGSKMMEAGVGMSGTGVGAVAGVPLAVVGGATLAAGKATEVGGKVVEGAGKVAEVAGKATEKVGETTANVGKGVEKAGATTRNVGKNIKDTGDTVKEVGKELREGIPQSEDSEEELNNYLQ
jgi:hypothetical protein